MLIKNKRELRLPFVFPHPIFTWMTGYTEHADLEFLRIIMIDKHAPPVFKNQFYFPRYWPTWLFLFLFRAVALLPIRVNFWIGRFLGLLFFHLAPSRRHIAKINIQICFPELTKKEQDSIVSGVLRSCGIGFMETAMALWGQKDKFKDCHEFIGGEHLEAAAQGGKGVLLVGSHLTTMDVAGRILTQYFPIDTLYLKDKNPLMAFALTKARNKFITNSIVRKDTRQLIRNLRKGHVVWYAADQDYGIKHAVFAPFFGMSAASLTATARIASMGNALVLPFSHYRNESGFYKVEIGPPLDNYPVGDDLIDATSINKMVEVMIRRAPDQYLWVHRRFKSRPEGEKKLY